MVGKATLTITVNSDNIQISNFGNNSFQINNTGDKNIVQVDIDVTDALYPDSVFDPFGVAGDTAFKALTINTDEDTGVSAPNEASYIGAGGAAGYKGLRLLFDETVSGGFNPGETIGFSIDMDPNSAAGTRKGPLDNGSTPFWDVGGVSGAELIGSSFTVTFDDGTTATGQLHGAGNQAGSKGIASQDSPNLPVNLTVNGLDAGGIGTYNPGGPSVIVNGPAGETARVVLTKGFIQPIDPYAQFLENQLNELAATVFPANNAVEFQTVDIVLTGNDQDISDLFDFTEVPADFSADPAFPLSLDEDKLPLGFVASIIDPNEDDLPLGPVTAPIYLQFSDEITPPPSGTPFEIEAEAADSLSGYNILNNNLVSGGQLIQTGTQGTATYTFNGASGQYIMSIGTIDENDGNATLDVSQNGTFLNTIVFDQPTNSGFINASNQIERTVATVTVTTGDSFTITGTRDAGEFARFDFIRFDPVGEVTPLAPTITTTNVIAVAENQTAVLDVNATDADGDTEGNGLTFSLTGGADQSSFDINADTGVLSFNAAPDFENPGDADTDNIYEVNVTVTDSDTLTASQTISVTVGDVNENGGSPIRLEAEATDAVVNYRIENIGAASGNQVLSFRGNGGNEVGSAAFGFNETPGTYDIIVGAFDENDGLASFTIEVNGTEVGEELLLDQELGSNVANAQTFITETIALGVNLTPGDIITVNGFEQGSEHARLDFIELVPTV